MPGFGTRQCFKSICTTEPVKFAHILLASPVPVVSRVRSGAAAIQDVSTRTGSLSRESRYPAGLHFRRLVQGRVSGSSK
jgi:hypothetical protein